MIEFRQLCSVLGARHSFYHALQGQAGEIGDVAGTVSAILRFEEFVIHLGEAEADHLFSVVRAIHTRESSGGQDNCNHLATRLPRFNLLFLLLVVFSQRDRAKVQVSSF